MGGRKTAAAKAGRVTRVPIPKTREPFVNTPLMPVGKDERGLERFWISSWNSVMGCMAVLVNETGEHRIFRFKPPHPGFYSAVQEDEDTLWLCGSLDKVVRFSLADGKYEAFETGAPAALVFQGMALDKTTGKLFAAAFPPPTISAFSFDIRNREPVRVYSDFTPEHYMRFSFPNGDGTWSIVLTTSGESLLRWNPVSNNLEAVRLSDKRDPNAGYAVRLIHDDGGRYYFPGRGWYDAGNGTFDSSGPKPDREMTWLARRGDKVYGAGQSVSEWDVRTGRVRDVCSIPGANAFNTNLTESGKIVCVNTQGEFYRCDAETGALEISKSLPTDAIGHVDCLCRFDDERLLGTPFITQRFWEVNIRTGEGRDCGKAAPGGGEILQVRKMGGKIYMAAYTGGELVEYDPQKHPHFPENPRIVADPPGGMRPVAAADDGRNIFYSCSAPYGNLGSVLTKYDTKTGLCRYTQDPLPGQQIRSLCYDKKANALLAGTTFHSDCQSCPPSSETCWIARISAEDLSVEAKTPAPPGTIEVKVEGPLGKGGYLCRFLSGKGGWAAVDIGNLRTPDESELLPLPEGFHSIRYSGRPGRFVLQIGKRLELWDMSSKRRLRVLCDGFKGYRFEVQDGSLYLVRPKEILILEGCLKGV